MICKLIFVLLGLFDYIYSFTSLSSDTEGLCALEVFSFIRSPGLITYMYMYDLLKTMSHIHSNKIFSTFTNVNHVNKHLKLINFIINVIFK